MATEKSSAMTKLNDITECCICLKTFTDPRILPCIHTFCLHCLQDMVDKTNGRPLVEMKCPVCRKEFTIPSNGVEGIQKNFFMSGMTEVRNALNQSGIVDISCEICQVNIQSADGIIPDASYRCLVCLENLCESCCKMHKSFKVSKNHEILKIGGNIGDKEAVKNLQTMNCDIHHGRMLDYYCFECKKVVCVSCFVESHKTHDCKDVKTVEEEFRQIIQSNAYVISALAGELLNKRKKLESKDDFIEKMAEREEEILDRSEELKEMIDEHTKSLLSSLLEIKNRHLKEIETDEEELDRRVALMESFSSYCNEVRTKGSDSDVCRSKDELLRRGNELKEDHETYILDRKDLYEVTFVATDLDHALKTAKGNIIGYVNGNVEPMDDFVLAIGRNDDARWNWGSYKIKLHGHSGQVSSVDNLTAAVKSSPAAAVYDNTMFIAGIGEALNELWKYNVATGWTKGGSLVQGRESHCAEFIDETLYICGGSRENIVIYSIEAYNVTRRKTAIVGQLRFGFESAASVVYEDSLYLFGGLDRAGQQLDRVQKFSVSGYSSTCTILSTTMPRPCAFMRALVWDKYAILLGYEACMIFDFENKTWQERQQFRTDAILFGMVLETERIFIIGGLPVKAVERVVSNYEALDDVKYIKASAIVNNEAAEWKSHCNLPKPMGIAAFAKLSVTKPEPVLFKNPSTALSKTRMTRILNMISISNDELD